MLKAAGRQWLYIKAVCQSVREATASGVDNAAWLADTNGLFHPQRERLITMQKQLEGTQKYTRAVQIELPIDGQLMHYCEHTRLPAEYKCLK